MLDIPSEEAPVRNEAFQVLTGLSELEPETLVREQELGTVFNFSQGLPYFRRLLRFYRRVGEVPLDELPFNKVTEVANHAKQAWGLFQKVQEFSPGIENPVQQRDQLIQQIKDHHERAYTTLAPVLAFASMPTVDMSSIQSEVAAVADETKKALESAKNSGSTAVSELQSLLASAKQSAQEVGVVQHAVHFRTAAADHDTAADLWLKVTAAFAGAALLLALSSLLVYAWNPPEWDTLQAIQVAAAKLVVLSLLVSGTVWSGRTYRAHRHNHVVNKHRQNALSTFETFAASAPDQQTKSAVLLHAAQCIFAPQQTGYDSGEADAGSTPQLIEVFRSLGQS